MALEDTPQVALDACTLNNLMNAVQIAILLAVLKWVRAGGDDDDRGDDERRRRDRVRF